MTKTHTYLSRNARARAVTLALVGGALVLAVGAFAFTPGSATPGPVSFDEVTSAGLTAEQEQELEERGVRVPRAQIFYSQYQYVVGFTGIEYAIDDLQQPGHEQQFGYPVAVWVTDYTDTGVTLTDRGYPKTTEKPDWVEAGTAHFVVGSDARSPSGETVLPFESARAADAFVERHGGKVVDWAGVQRHDFDIERGSAVREQVDDRDAAADRRVNDARDLTERDVSVVVGRNVSTVQEAINTAPPESTVLVPRGTYRETPIVVNKSLTIRGQNASIRGDGNGSVLHIESDDVAVTGFSISGVGESREPDPKTNLSDQWDQNIRSSYGYADAGIQAVDVSGTYVADVEVETPAHGILLRGADGVVEGVSIEGSDDWEEGFMGLIALHEPVVVQDSQFEGGRDAIYLHRSHETVIRNNTFRSTRYGAHLMYTSDALVANNTGRNLSFSGVVIMTDPEGNAVVGNDIRNSSTGLSPGGSRAYVAENVLVNNGRGLTTGTSQSLYERNVVYGNDLGVRTGSIRPTNRIVRNDFVANERTIEVGGVGPLKIWTRDGHGNYWEDGTVLAGRTDSYVPSGPLERRYDDVPGTVTLSASPVATALDAVRDTTPGMREGEVIDTAPRSEPVRPEVIERLEDEYDE